MQYDLEFSRWRERAADDADVVKELASIVSSPDEIEDRFFQTLGFGTGGLRGVIGAGTNRMNLYTVRKATQGLARYLLNKGGPRRAAIAYDSRHKSQLFAQAAAGVFAANGIQAYLYTRLAPTPALSFAVRELGCCGGVVITASHNPARYNGYKVYDVDGCQVTDDAAADISACIDAVDIFDGVLSIPFEEGLARGVIHYISADVEEKYKQSVCAQSLLPEGIDHGISIVYTPLNGAGIGYVPDCLARCGFKNMIIPASQAEPDGDFPTCPYPNPEFREALEVGLACARENECDMLLATDPDSDRVGAAVRDEDDYTLITGNQMGVLLFDFICRMRLLRNTMPLDPVAVKTIVTTPMTEKVAEKYGVTLLDVITGFKYIGEQIGFLEARNEESRYLFGFEESYGYLCGTYVRDKDAVSASLLISEMAAYYRQTEHISLSRALEKLYDAFGAYSERQTSFTFGGVTGLKTMRHIMRSLRASPPHWPGVTVTAVRDYLQPAADAHKEAGGVHLPPADVIKFTYQNGSTVIVRPSGTEPKLKIYFFAASARMAEADKQSEEMANRFRVMIDQLAAEAED